MTAKCTCSQDWDKRLFVWSDILTEAMFRISKTHGFHAGCQNIRHTGCRDNLPLCVLSSFGKNGCQNFVAATCYMKSNQSECWTSAYRSDLSLSRLHGDKLLQLGA